MRYLTTSLWGRDFELKVYMEHCSDEEVLPSQERTLEELMRSWQTVENSLEPVKLYCIENNGQEIGGRPISNIFKYVVPQTLYVSREDEGRVILLCAYRFDMEHGIGVEFVNNELGRIDQQDMLI